MTARLIQNDDIFCLQFIIWMGVEVFLFRKFGKFQQTFLSMFLDAVIVLKKKL